MTVYVSSGSLRKNRSSYSIFGRFARNILSEWYSASPFVECFVDRDVCHWSVYSFETVRNVFINYVIWRVCCLGRLTALHYSQNTISLKFCGVLLKIGWLYLGSHWRNLGSVFYYALFGLQYWTGWPWALCGLAGVGVNYLSKISTE